MDFLAVSLLNGFVTVAVSLGGRPSSFDLRDGNRLDDGKWHHVEIKRVKKVRTVHLQVLCFPCSVASCSSRLFSSPLVSCVVRHFSSFFLHHFMILFLLVSFMLNYPHFFITMYKTLKFTCDADCSFFGVCVCPGDPFDR